MKKRGQSTVEYLVLVSFILLIILLIVFVLANPLKLGSHVSDRGSKLYWKSAPIAIEDFIFYDKGNLTLLVKNNNDFDIKILSFKIDGKEIISSPLTLGVGYRKEIKSYLNKTCDKIFDYDVVIVYKQMPLDAVRTFQGEESLKGDCSTMPFMGGTWYIRTESDFDQGSYSSTEYGASSSALVLSLPSTSGSYTSKIFNSTYELTNWDQINWSTDTIYGIDMPDNKAVESGGLDMSGNLLLLHLDENSGTLSDSSGESNDGTSYGGITYGADGIYDKALKFDGSNDKINIDEQTPLNLTSSFSYGAWFKADNFSTWAGIMSRMRSWGHGYNLQVGNSQKIACGWGVYTQSDVAPQIGKWYLAVCVYNNSQMKLYVNSVQQSDVDSGTMDVGVDNLQLGVFYTSSSSSTSLPFNGTIDEAFVFDRALSEDEIQKMYQRGIYRLNVSARSCDDPSCNGESFTTLGQTSPQSLSSLSSNEYFQFKLDLSTLDNSSSLKVYNVSVDYS